MASQASHLAALAYQAPYAPQPGLLICFKNPTPPPPPAQKKKKKEKKTNKSPNTLPYKGNLWDHGLALHMLLLWGGIGS